MIVEIERDRCLCNRGNVRRLRKKLAEIECWNASEGPNQIITGAKELGIITSGVATMHCLVNPDALGVIP